MTVAAGHALACVREWLGSERPEAAVVLGSGLGGFVSHLERPRTLAYSAVPGFPAAAVQGHAGELVAGRLGGRDILVQRGRFHAYEGHDTATLTLPVRLAAGLGVRVLIVTNAAGGIHPLLAPGDLMLIADQVNLSFRNPLTGPVAPGETRFPDMSDAYDAGLRRMALAVAREESVAVREGVYAGMPGPAYETPAEIRMLRRLGADAVGMSTVLEVVTARALGLRCLGFSIITNRAAGLGSGTLTHADVLARAGLAGEALGRLLAGVLRRFR